ncbi:YkvI family membrane protein [Metabacillus sp. 84]|uniref:YkvI family membrane protein n=1 Tax=Metabacillus sp. 84 TaxID=3404705 RepID=UPI003CF6B444
MRNKQFLIVQIAFVYVGTVVGAGFATGKEIVEFFSRFGAAGTLGILLAGGLFVHLGTKLMIIAARVRAPSFKEMNEYLMGKKAGKAVNSMMMLLLFGVTSVMVSGAGAIFEERFGLSSSAGVLASILITLLVMSRGLHGVVGVNMLVVPMLILLSAAIMGSSIKDGGLPVLYSAVNWHDFSWILSAVCYAAYNLALAQAVLVPLAYEVKDEDVLKHGGMLGGMILMFIMLGSHLALIHIPGAIKFEIPMAEVMNSVFSAAYHLYVLVIFGEVLTSIIGNLYGMERRLSKLIRLPRMSVIAIILGLCFFLSFIGYGKLISSIYPVLGYISLLFLAALLFKKKPIK